MTTIKGKSAAGFVGACTIAGILASLLGGCDLPPAGAVTADGRAVKVLAVSTDDPAEVAAAGALLQANVDYKHALTVLHTFYDQTGALTEQIWAEDEIGNLAQARTFAFEGAPDPTAPGSESVVEANEAALVERLFAARKAWKKSLAKLGDYYKAKGNGFKAALIRNVQSRFDPIKEYSYYMKVEVPPATLKGTTAGGEAEVMFNEALKLYRQGKLIPLLPDYRKERRALMMFRELIDKHDDSVFIARSAYYIGEIYKEYFDANIRAVAWYERAWQWDPELLLPARFQAATVYDLRMGWRVVAVELYREVIKHESHNLSNVNFAVNRIDELTRKIAEEKAIEQQAEQAKARAKRK